MAKDRYNPYVGLRPFKKNESHLFFGREELTKDVLENLAKNCFAAILGASGAGKSSFVFCSLLPALESGYSAGAKNKWISITYVPRYTDPLTILIDRIFNSIENSQSESILDSDNAHILKKIHELIPADTNLFIFIDQFEELFRSSPIQQQERFLRFLIDASDPLKKDIYILLTVRSDLIGYCAEFPDFTKKLNSGQFLIPKMTREQKKRAIVRPIAIFQDKIDDELVELLLDDEEKGANLLPVMQHALMLTWQNWFNGGAFGSIGISNYITIGTMNNAISNHANEVFNQLDDNEKDVAEHLFRTIVINEKGIEMRNPTRFDIICGIIDYADRTLLIDVINKFRDEGRSFLIPRMEHEIYDNTIIDISHESLIRLWNLLAIWAEKEKESVKQYYNLAERSILFKEGKVGRLTGAELQIALSWRKNEKPTKQWAVAHHSAYESMMIYLDHSENEEIKHNKYKALMVKRKMAIQRVLFLIFFIIGIAGIILAFYASRKSLIAQKAKEDAEKSAQLALSEKEIANLERKNAEKKTLEALESKKVALNQTTIAQNEAYRADNALSLAILNKNLALQKKTEADSAAELAKKEKNNAENAKIEAMEAKYSLYILAEAKSLSDHSIALFNDKDYKTSCALALHSYYLNLDFNGSTQVTSIYKAMDLNLKNKNQVNKKIVMHKFGVVQLESSSAEGMFFSAGIEGDILIWQSNANQTNFNKSTESIVTITKISDLWKKSIKCISYSIAGKSLYAATGSSISKYTVVNSKPTFQGQVFNTENDVINKFVVSNFGGTDNLFVTGNKGIYIVRVENNSSLLKNTTAIQGTQCAAVALRGDSVLFATGSTDMHLRIYSMKQTDLSNPKLIVDYNLRRKITALEFSPKTNLLAFGTSDGLVSLLETYTFQSYSTLLGHIGLITDIKFNPLSENQLATSSLDKTARIWIVDKKRSEEPIILQNTNWINSLEFSFDGNFIYTADAGGEIITWPAKMELLANALCSFSPQKISKEEMKKYTPADIKYKKPNCVSFDDK